MTSYFYLGQSFTPKEMKISCDHRFRLCDCGAVHCLGACGFWQERIFAFEEKREKIKQHRAEYRRGV